MYIHCMWTGLYKDICIQALIEHITLSFLFLAFPVKCWVLCSTFMSFYVHCSMGLCKIQEPQVSKAMISDLWDGLNLLTVIISSCACFFANGMTPTLEAQQRSIASMPHVVYLVLCCFASSLWCSHQDESAFLLSGVALRLNMQEP